MTRDSDLPKSYFIFWALLFTCAYGFIFWTPFFYDDQSFLLKNPLVTGPWPGLKEIFTTYFADKGEYGPLFRLGHWLLFHLAGPNPFLYRLTSLALHAANSWLFFRLCRSLMEDSRAALGAAVLFSLFPAHVQVLAVSCFKKHLGVLFFGLLLLNIQACALPKRWRVAGCWACLGLGLLTNESALPWPLVAFAVGGASSGGLRRFWKEERLLYAGLFAMAMAYAIGRIFLLPRALAPLAGAGWPSHIFTSAKILMWYLPHLVFPVQLCLEHSLSPVASARESACLLAGLAAVGYGWWRLYHRDPVAWAGGAWLVLTLAPFLNLVPSLNFSLVADRYLYSASAGFFLLAGSLARGLGKQAGRFLRTAVPAAALCYAALGIRYGVQFSDPLTLWKATALCASDNPRAHAALGASYLQRGLFEPAVTELRRALELAPNYDSAALDLGRAYAGRGDIESAIRLTEEWVKTYPKAASFWNNLGLFRLSAGRKDQALAAFQKAAMELPEDGGVQLNLGLCHLDIGLWSQARLELERAARQESVRAKAFGALGDLDFKRKDAEAAASFYEKSLALEPMQWDVVQKLSRLYASGGRRGQALALLDGFRGRLEAGLAARAASLPAPAMKRIEDILHKVQNEKQLISRPPPSAGR